jgi:hypothetical protein
VSTPPGDSWDSLCGSLPSHQDALMDSYGGGEPSIAVQDKSHGAGIPAVDRGPEITVVDGVRRYPVVG